jgi:hypothetical protein
MALPGRFTIRNIVVPLRPFIKQKVWLEKHYYLSQLL